MKIILNGEDLTLPGPSTLAELLDELEFRQVHLAVALNETFVPRALRVQTPLSEGDRVEIVAPMQGG